MYKRIEDMTNDELKDYIVELQYENSIYEKENYILKAKVSAREIVADKYEEKINSLKEYLKNKEESLRESVKYYEEQLRKTDKNNFYYESYVKTIQRANAVREFIKEISDYINMEVQ